MQALLVRRYTQVEKLLSPLKVDRARQALRKASWLRPGRLPGRQHPQGQGIQGGPEQEAHERHNTPYQVVLHTLLPFQQAQDDLRRGEVREHPKQHPHHSGQDRPLQAALLSLSQLPQTDWRPWY